jgi:hypothetical protein
LIVWIKLSEGEAFQLFMEGKFTLCDCIVDTLVGINV